MSSSALQVAKTATYLPDLVEVQRASFKWFLEKGLIEELQNFSPISDYTGKLELHFVGEEYRLKRPRHDVEEAKRRDATFASQMYVTCRLINKETGEIKEQEVFIGELPLMTERGTFIINGAERVIVNQIVRSPGVYFKDELDKNGRRTYNASVIPNRGAWLKFETDKNNLLYVRVDKTRKINAHVLMRAMGLSDNDVVDKLRHPEFYQSSIESANDEGIYSEDQESLSAAIEAIKAIVADPEPGTIYNGKVVRIVDFGAFVNFMPGTDGLVHISQIAEERVEKVTDYLSEGQDVKVKVIEIDNRGRVKLSIKEAVEKAKTDDLGDADSKKDKA